MGDITKGVTFSGVSPGNEVTPERLNNLVDAASIHTSFYTGKTAETAAAVDDYLLFFDASSGTFKKIQVQHFVPTVSAVLTGFKKLVIKNNSANPNFQADVTADEIVMRTAGGNVRRTTAFSRTVDITVFSGGPTVDGRDFSSESSSTWYWVWAISDGSNDRLLLSASETAPTYPTGYSYGCLLGAIRNDASSNFLRFIQQGLDVYQAPQIPTIQGGTAFTAQVPAVAGTFEAVDLSACVPSLANEVSGWLASPTSGANMRAAIATEGTGALGALTAEIGLQYMIYLSSTNSTGGFFASLAFSCGIKTAQRIDWTKEGPPTATMRINGYRLNL